MLIAFCANFAMCFRNCGTKKYNLLTKKRLDYPEVCSYSLLPQVAFIFIEMNIHGWNYELPSTQLVIASLFHVAYR